MPYYSPGNDLVQDWKMFRSLPKKKQIALLLLLSPILFCIFAMLFFIVAGIIFLYAMLPLLIVPTIAVLLGTALYRDWL